MTGSRRWAMAAFVAAMALPAAARAETALNIMVYQGVQNLPIFAASAKGFFAKRGLRVDAKIAPNSDEQRAGLAEGRWQIIHSAIDNGVAMVEAAKVDAVAVIGGDNSLNHLVVQPDIKSPAELRGKTVIVDALNTAYAFQLYSILQRNGLVKGDYTVKSVGATFKRLEAMQQDPDNKAAMLNVPFWISATKGGLSDLGSAVKVIGPYQATSGIVLRSWAKQNPDTLVNYLQAYIEGLRWALDPANKVDATAMLANGLHLTPEIASATYAAAVDPVDGLARDAKFDLEGFKNVLALRHEFEGGVLNSPEKYIDLSYYQKALAGL